MDSQMYSQKDAEFGAAKIIFDGSTLVRAVKPKGKNTCDGLHWVAKGKTI